ASFPDLSLDGTRSTSKSLQRQRLSKACSILARPRADRRASSQPARLETGRCFDPRFALCVTGSSYSSRRVIDQPASLPSGSMERATKYSSTKRRDGAEWISTNRVSQPRKHLLRC